MDYQRKIMKQGQKQSIKYSFRLLTVSLLLLCGCNKNDETCGENVRLRISEKIPYDLGWTDKTEDFYYTGNSLTKVITTQITTTTYFSPYVDKDTVQVSCNIEYSEKQISITEDNGNELIYTLNEQNYADKCRLTEYGSNKTRYYTFNYTPQGMLASITEENGSLQSSCNISYTDNGNIEKTTNRQYNTEFSLNYIASNIENKWSFPCPIIIEAYPFYFHRIAFYMGVLGKLSNHLIEKVTPEGTANEETVYSYVNNAAGYVTSCIEKTVSYGKTYSREINYTYY